jgi:hypothetical protein
MKRRGGKGDHGTKSTSSHCISAARIGGSSTLCSVRVGVRVAPAAPTLASGIRQDQPRVIWPRVGRKIQRWSAENPENPRLPALEHQILNFTGLSANHRHPKPSTLTATTPIPSQWPVPRRLPKRSPRREQRFQSTSTALCAPAIR